MVHGAKSLLCAIDKRITIATKKIHDQKIVIKTDISDEDFVIPRKVSYLQIDPRVRPVYYIADTLAKKVGWDKGVHIDIESELPLGAGLGSSSACCVAGASALLGLFGLNRTKNNILKIAIDAERTAFPKSSGADCTVCTLGGAITYVKNANNQNAHTNKIDFSNNIQIIIADSDMPHSTEAIVNTVSKFKKQNPVDFESMSKKINMIIHESCKSLACGDVTKLGKLALDNQEYLEEIGVSNDTLRRMIKSISRIAAGAKITGAGGGGCIIVFADDTHQDEVILKLAQMSAGKCFVTGIGKGVDPI